MDEVLNQASTPSLASRGARPKWQPSEESFARLLRWLDGGEDSHGEKYEEMRRRLIAFFDRRNCLVPEELADETLDRAMKWLEKSGQAETSDPAKVCYKTARFVFLESLREPEPDELDDLSPAQQPAEDPRVTEQLNEAGERRQKRRACLQQCSQQLPEDDRDLILRYYHGEQRVKLDSRKALAAERGMTSNALNIKACRIRNKLRACIDACCA